jgi:hypothetical protein
MDKPSKAELDEMVAEATVDCYDDDEARSGFLTTLQDELVVPFTTTVLGVEVTVGGVTFSGGQIVAICTRGKTRQAVGILDLPLPSPEPEGAAWIEAYRRSGL